MRLRLFATILLFVGLFQVRADSSSSVLTEIPFQYREGLLWLNVRTPQSTNSLNFLLDTGASVSVVNLETADSLGFKRGNQILVRGVQSTTVGFWLKHVPVSLGELQLPENYLAVDLGKLGRSCHCTVDGLIGADFFRDRVVQIDFKAQKIRLLSSNPQKISGEILPLETRGCGMCVAVSINDGKAKRLRLDTGCASALQWVTKEVKPEDCSHRVVIALTEIVVPVTQTTVGIGATEFESVPTELHQSEIFAGEAGLLGNGLLSRFSVVTIDTKRKHLIFEH